MRNACRISGVYTAPVLREHDGLRHGDVRQGLLWGTTRALDELSDRRPQDPVVHVTEVHSVRYNVLESACECPHPLLA